MIRDIINRYVGEVSLPCRSLSIDIAKQGLDTSVFALLSAVDECGRVNNLAYSEDSVVSAYSDSVINNESRVTDYENDYYSQYAINASENSQSSSVVAAEVPSAGESSFNAASQSQDNLTS